MGCGQEAPSNTRTNGTRIRWEKNKFLIQYHDRNSNNIPGYRRMTNIVKYDILFLNKKLRAIQYRNTTVGYDSIAVDIL